MNFELLSNNFPFSHLSLVVQEWQMWWYRMNIKRFNKFLYFLDSILTSVNKSFFDSSNNNALPLPPNNHEALHSWTPNHHAYICIRIYKYFLIYELYIIYKCLYHSFLLLNFDFYPLHCYYYLCSIRKIHTAFEHFLHPLCCYVGISKM